LQTGRFAFDQSTFDPGARERRIYDQDRYDQGLRRNGEDVEAPRAKRRLAAILMADVAGYSRLVGADEDGTLRRWRAHWDELIAPTILAHGGRIARVNGDGILAEFASAVSSVECAAALQSGMRARNADVAARDRMEFRIGINIGDVIFDRGDMWGESVNVAARLEALAEPGGLCVTARVQDMVANTLDIPFEDLGERRLKNIARAVRIYRARLPGRSAAEKPPARPETPDADTAPDRGGAAGATRRDLRTATHGFAVAIAANTLVSLLVAGGWWLAASPAATTPPAPRAGFALAGEARQGTDLPATDLRKAPAPSVVVLPKALLPSLKP